MTALKACAALRDAGWSVAVHNDYRLSGKPMTFWLWTHSDGRWIKGEGANDDEALSACLQSLAAWNSRAPGVSVTREQIIAVVEPYLVSFGPSVANANARFMADAILARIGGAPAVNKLD